MDERPDGTPAPEQETTVMADDAAPTRLVGTERMARPADAAPSLGDTPMLQDDAPAAARIEALEQRVRHDRIAIGVLVALVAILAVVVAFMAAGTLSAPSTQAPAAGVQDAVEAEDTGDENADTPDGVNSREDTGADTGTDTEDADDAASSDGERLRAADLVSIVGQKWSNAKLMLDALGVDESDLVITTNDGGMVFDAGNWTVSTVTDLEDSGKVEVRLRHDIAW